MKAFYFIILITINTNVIADILISENRLQRIERQVRKISVLMLKLENIQAENRQLRGELEEQQHLLTQFKRHQQELARDFDERIEKLAHQQRSVAQPTQNTITTAPPTLIDKPRNEQADYQRAYHLLSPKQKQYDAAILAFQQFIKNYPQSKLLPNAYYWLGEANYVKQQNKPAFNAFNTVVQNFPNSPKAAGSLLKMGYIQLSRGKTSVAREILQQVIKKYPSSTVARMARTRLKEII